MPIVAAIRSGEIPVRGLPLTHPAAFGKLQSNIKPGSPGEGGRCRMHDTLEADRTLLWLVAYFALGVGLLMFAIIYHIHLM